MKILYGTANPAKLRHMRVMLDGLGLEVTGLRDMQLETGHIDESGDNPLENARIKALAYYRAITMPTFSCDSGLYIAGMADKRQPGVHVRRVQGKVLSDEEMIGYYAGLALELGGKAEARYKNAICLVLDENNIFEYDGDDISSPPFLITSEIHPGRIEGFPLDSISLELKTGKYYMDMDSGKDFALEEGLTRGFREFFIRSIGPLLSMEGMKRVEKQADLRIVRTDGGNEDFAGLIKLLDEDLSGRYGALQKQYEKYNTTDRINDVVIVYKDNVPAACGAFKVYDSEAVELKRIFVAKEQRRQGLARLIVHELEESARRKGYGYALLETGIKQHEAIRLYKSAGYETIPNYGPYAGNTNSVCMRKAL